MGVTFRVGDRVRCKPGFTNTNYESSYGGAGYENGRVYTIRMINLDRRGVAFSVENPDYGVFLDALEYVVGPAKTLSKFKFV